jgi:phospholipase C
VSLVQASIGVAPGRCGYGPRLPLLVISPYARRNFVDHMLTDQTSIARFIEDNWGLPRLGDGAMDQWEGSLVAMFDFDHACENRLADSRPGDGCPGKESLPSICRLAPSTYWPTLPAAAPIRRTVANRAENGWPGTQPPRTGSPGTRARLGVSEMLELRRTITSRHRECVISTRSDLISTPQSSVMSAA